MENEKGFHWNVWFIGKDGYRESFNIEAETADEISSRREAILSLLSEVGAVPDTRPFGTGVSESKGPSKLDKFKKQQSDDESKKPPFVPSTEPETKEESVVRLVENEVITPEEGAQIAAENGLNTDKLAAASAKLKKAAKPKTETPSADVLKPSKLAKYAKPER